MATVNRIREAFAACVVVGAAACVPAVTVKTVKNPAGWRQTKWGMTVEQAAAVLGPEAEVISAVEARRRGWEYADGALLTRLWIPAHELANRRFEVHLAFHEIDGLQTVIISPRDASGFGALATREAIFRDLESELRTEYGSPSLLVNNSQRHDLTWRFSDTDVALHLIRFADQNVGFLRLVYGPRGADERWHREHGASSRH
jgi:hypothetical protein